MKPEERVLKFIPVGRKHAISRERLVHATGMNDRNVRDAIHHARRVIPIINLSNGGGYYIPDMNNPEDVKALIRFVRQEESRLKSVGWALKTARQTLRNCDIDWKTYKDGG